MENTYVKKSKKSAEEKPLNDELAPPPPPQPTPGQPIEQQYHIEVETDDKSGTSSIVLIPAGEYAVGTTGSEFQTGYMSEEVTLEDGNTATILQGHQVIQEQPTSHDGGDQVQYVIHQPAPQVRDHQSSAGKQQQQHVIHIQVPSSTVKTEEDPKTQQFHLQHMLQLQQRQQPHPQKTVVINKEVAAEKTEQDLMVEEFEVDKARVVKKLHELLAFLKSTVPLAMRKTVLDSVKGPLLGTILPSSLPRKRVVKDEPTTASSLKMGKSLCQRKKLKLS